MILSLIYFIKSLLYNKVVGQMHSFLNPVGMCFRKTVPSARIVPLYRRVDMGGDVI